MVLRINQYIFALFIFSLKGALLASLLYEALLGVVALTPGAKPDIGILNSAIYVCGVSFLCGGLAFIASICAKKAFGLRGLRAESYWFVGFAALLANLVAATLIGIGLSSIHLAIYTASAISIYLGAGIYRKTWRTLEELGRSSN